ncbi:MAG: pseudouridine-5'-phosphate glycosidase [Acidobacteria bacterium]|nr:pseudouridine-5'-phosphate glycosidase [Acidobacteriota bacterium]
MKIKFGDEVKQAMRQGLPIVALESTIISHGLPYPQNLEAAINVENIIRTSGGIPATIAVFNGDFCVGLTDSQIEDLATRSDIKKISTRDLPIAAARKETCATTVATTSFIARRAGIKVFSTGGIGGVHRGGLLDISADLPMLAKTPIVVVCSGAKIILDLPATREWLETYGVSVLGFRCDEMPAFYSRKSGLPVDQRVDSIEEIVEVVRFRDELKLRSAVLVTVPVPEEDEVDPGKVNEILDSSLKTAAENKITGKDLTPFLLSEMSKLSGGKTLDANIALFENNARKATQIAVSLNRS